MRRRGIFLTCKTDRTRLRDDPVGPITPRIIHRYSMEQLRMYVERTSNRVIAQSSFTTSISRVTIELNVM